jgi:hypothetical protein
MSVTINTECGVPVCIKVVIFSTLFGLIVFDVVVEDRLPGIKAAVKKYKKSIWKKQFSQVTLVKRREILLPIAHRCLPVKESLLHINQCGF